MWWLVSAARTTKSTLLRRARGLTGHQLRASSTLSTASNHKSSPWKIHGSGSSSSTEMDGSCNSSFSSMATAKSSSSSPNLHFSGTVLQQAAKIPTVTVAIMRETYDTWERRTPLAPQHVHELVRLFAPHTLGEQSVADGNVPKVQFQVLVQPSSQRIYSDREYQAAGAIVQDDISSADIILGVKRPAPDFTADLYPNKTYLFFSHVIKGQPANMALLQDCLKKRIQLIDYEKMVQKWPGHDKPRRVVSFGRYAGMAGMFDSFHVLGRRLLHRYGAGTPFLNCPPSIMHDNVQQAKERILRVGEHIYQNGLGGNIQEPLIFCVTGKGGVVHGGVMEILQLLPHELLTVDQLADVVQHREPQHQVHILPVGTADCFQKKQAAMTANDKDIRFDRNDFQENPANYRSVFPQRIAPYIHVLMNCVYWDPRFPRLLTKQQMKRLEEEKRHRLLLLSDISCDIGGSVEFLLRSTTIEKPHYQYDPMTGLEIDDGDINHGITVMGVDILPTQLPRDASNHFGDSMLDLLKELIEAKKQMALNAVAADEGDAEAAAATFGVDPSLLSSRLADACITQVDGTLAPGFRYLDPMMKQHSHVDMAASHKEMTVTMEGHLFDSGLINQVLDAVEAQDCLMEIQQCVFPPSSEAANKFWSKSSVILRITGKDYATLDKVEAKMKALVNVIEKAEAKMSRIDSKKLDGSSGSGTGSSRRAYVEGPKREKHVLLLGAGMVSKSVVDLLGRSEDTVITVASDIEKEAKKIASVAAKGRGIALDVVNNVHKLADLIEHSDVVISMLPATMHAPIAHECIEHRTDLVTASYESQEMRDLNEQAKAAGIRILNEVGLDPGLDHMSAMKIIDDIKERGGIITGFTSVCGGLPAPEAANNPFQYKFSWSPMGVIRASQNDARYRRNGKIVEVEGKDLLRAATPFTDAWSDLGLECLPNRDSLQYEDVYDIAGADTLFRGTLRYEGFCSLLNVLKNMGFFKTDKITGKGWKDILSNLRKEGPGGKSFDDLEEFVKACAHGNEEEAKRALDTLEWLGIVGGRQGIEAKSVIDAFCAVLQDKLKYGPSERDMVAMHHTIEASFNHGHDTECHHSSLLVFGDASMSAMTKTVGFTAAASAELLLNGTLANERGLLLPTSKKIYEPVLAAVEKEGIVFEESMFDNSHKTHRQHG